MGSFFRNIPPVTKNLLIINVLIWLALYLLGSGFTQNMEHYGALHFFTSPDFIASQLITYMFIQVDFWHLFFNMFALFMFGSIIEQVLGSKRYLFFFIACGLGAALIQEGVFALIINHKASIYPDGTLAEVARLIVSRNGELYYNPEALQELARLGVSYTSPTINNIWSMINTPTIGASGAVYGLLLAFGFIFPRRPIYLMFIPIPIQARWMVIGYGVIEFLQLSANNNDHVAHLAHLGGMLFALLMLLYWKKKGIIHVSPF